MKIILLIIPSMIYSTTEAMHSQTNHVDLKPYKILNGSIPTFKSISNEFNKTLYFNMTDFKNISTNISVIGELSRNYLNVNFSMIDNNLNELNQFNKATASFNNAHTNFVNIVISLINNIFKSIPEQDIEISNESEGLMRWLKMNNPNKITISVTHKWDSTQIRFRCYLEEDSKNISKTLNPNEEEEEVSKLLDKKEQ